MLTKAVDAGVQVLVHTCSNMGYDRLIGYMGHLSRMQPYPLATHGPVFTCIPASVPSESQGVRLYCIRCI